MDNIGNGITTGKQLLEATRDLRDQTFEFCVAKLVELSGRQDALDERDEFVLREVFETWVNNTKFGDLAHGGTFCSLFLRLASGKREVVVGDMMEGIDFVHDAFERSRAESENLRKEYRKSYLAQRKG